jgi:uncharacterized membrane protein YtjA (UPF0391 family)
LQSSEILIRNNLLGTKMNNMNKKGLGGWLFSALMFFILAIIAGIFGFGLISGASFAIAKWLAIIFVILFVISVVAHVIKNA